MCIGILTASIMPSPRHKQTVGGGSGTRIAYRRWEPLNDEEPDDNDNGDVYQGENAEVKQTLLTFNAREWIKER